MLDGRTERAWDDIESIYPDRVAAGNFQLIRREQGPVIQPYYDGMAGRLTGGVVTGVLTDRADTPIPGSETYRAHSGEGNVAVYPDRIRWITDSLWPAHQRLLETPGAVEELLGRDFDREVGRYRQVTPREVGEDALEAGRGAVKRAPAPLPITPEPLLKLIG